MKICINCNFEKSDSCFKPNSMKCIECYKEYQKNYRIRNKQKMKNYLSNYYKENKDEILESVKSYNIENKEKIAEYKSSYWEENKEYLKQKNSVYYQNNKERLNEISKKYKEEHRKEINQKRNSGDKKKIYLKLKQRRHSDPLYRISQNIRTYIRNTFKFKGYRKSTKTESILGCSFEQFKIHLESHFENWMNWENYGICNGELNQGWDIDHIIPISSAKSEDDILKLNHFTNLKPLCSFTNRYIKSNKIEIK